MTEELLGKLLDANFTKDEILQLAGIQKDQPTEPQPTPEPKPDPEPQPTPEPKPDPEPQPTPDQKPEPSNTDKRLDSIEETITKLIKTIQAGNVRDDRMKDNPDSLEEQTDKIMASIIRPEKAKREE